MSKDPMIGLELRLDQLLELTRPKKRRRQTRREKSQRHYGWLRRKGMLKDVDLSNPWGRPWPGGGKARLARGERGPRGGRTEAQALLFSRAAGWDARKAKAWAKRSGHNYGKVDVTDAYVRLRQRDPGAYKRLRTISLSDAAGIKAVIVVR